MLGRLIRFLAAQVFGPECVYPEPAHESIMAAIHYYTTEGVGDEQAVRGPRAA